MPEPNETSYSGILAVVSIFLFFLFIGHNGLLEPDGARYPEVAREMISTGDFITPRINYVIFFDKPVLHYWLTAVSFMIFGVNEFSAQFVPALLALLGVLSVYSFARRIYGDKTAFFAGLILATSFEYFALAHISSMDMTLTFFLTIALFSFCLGYLANEQAKKWWYYLAYFTVGLAVLTKGLIGMLLPGLVLFIWVVVTQQWKLLTEIRPWRGLLIITAVTAPWFIAITLRHPDYPYFFFIREHFVRYTSGFHQRTQPFYYFIPVLLAGAFPWLGFSFEKIKENLGAYDPERRTPRNITSLFTLWIVVTFLFFSFSNSKLPAYILPLFPALAVISGQALAEYTQNKRGRYFLIGWTTAFALAVPSFIILCFVLFQPEIRTNLPYIPGLAAAFAVMTCGLILAFWLHLQRSYKWACYTMLGAALCFYLILTPFPGRYEQVRSAKGLADIIAEYARPQDHIVEYRNFHHGLAFYLKRRIIVVDYKGDMEYGAGRPENREWFLTRGEFEKLWRKNQAVIAVMSIEDYYNMFKRSRASLYLLGRHGENIVISNKSRKELANR